MDIANYLSELLNQHNEVSVPGLGCFSRVRVNGYYNDAEGKFYPPRYQLQFEQQDKGDDILINYIAAKKNISLASSKYFTEKYINNLKHEIALHRSRLANLGWFHMVDGKIVFKPNEAYNEDAAFYGLSPLTLHKANHIEPVTPDEPVYSPPTPVIEQEDITESVYIPATSVIEQEDIIESVYTPPEPVIEQPGYILNEPEPVIDEPEPIVNETANTAGETGDGEQQSEEYTEDDYTEHRGLSTWVIVLLVIFIIASAVLTIYKFNPELLDRFQQKTDTAAVAQPVIPADTLKKDTTAAAPAPKAISTQDSTLSKSVVNTDTLTKPQFVIFVGSFKTTKKSEQEIKRYVKEGVDARLLTGPGTGPRNKIVVGSFSTYDEGEAERKKLLAAKKINKDSYTQQIINPKK